jgi:hypothetical protein
VSTYDVDPYRTARGSIAIHMSAGDANRTLLALEHLDQQSGLDPALTELRESIKAALITKSSGDVDSAPSTE